MLGGTTPYYQHAQKNDAIPSAILQDVRDAFAVSEHVTLTGTLAAQTGEIDYAAFTEETQKKSRTLQVECPHHDGAGPGSDYAFLSNKANEKRIENGEFIAATPSPAYQSIWRTNYPQTDELRRFCASAFEVDDRYLTQEKDTAGAVAVYQFDLSPFVLLDQFQLRRSSTGLESELIHTQKPNSMRVLLGNITPDLLAQARAGGKTGVQILGGIGVHPLNSSYNDAYAWSRSTPPYLLTVQDGKLLDSLRTGLGIAYLRVKTTEQGEETWELSLVSYERIAPIVTWNLGPLA